MERNVFGVVLFLLRSPLVFFLFFLSKIDSRDLFGPTAETKTKCSKNGSSKKYVYTNLNGVFHY